jgi:hypothetical protein
MGELYPDNFERLTNLQSLKAPASGCDHDSMKLKNPGTDERMRRMLIYSLPFTYDDDDKQESLLSSVR